MDEPVEYELYVKWGGAWHPEGRRTARALPIVGEELPFVGNVSVRVVEVDRDRDPPLVSAEEITSSS